MGRVKLKVSKNSLRRDCNMLRQVIALVGMKLGLTESYSANDLVARAHAAGKALAATQVDAAELEREISGMGKP